MKKKRKKTVKTSEEYQNLKHKVGVLAQKGNREKFDDFFNNPNVKWEKEFLSYEELLNLLYGKIKYLYKTCTIENFHREKIYELIVKKLEEDDYTLEELVKLTRELTEMEYKIMDCVKKIMVYLPPPNVSVIDLNLFQKIRRLTLDEKKLVDEFLNQIKQDRVFQFKLDYEKLVRGR